MDDEKEHPPPGANRGRASKERPKNTAPSLPQPHDCGQSEDNASRAFEVVPSQTDPSPDSFDLEARKTDVADAPEDGTDSADVVTIPKPNGFDLNKFRSKGADTIANVDTLQTGLSVIKISEAGDYVRLHPDEENYWSPELCLVNVPIKGSKRDGWHLIDEELARRFLPSGKIKRFRFALATKPNDVFFLCRIPTRNLDNKWNHDNITACENAKEFWTEVTNRSDEGVEGYLATFARDPDAFPKPKWPKQSLSDMIKQAFAGRTIDCEDHPALLRLIGAKQSVS
jgi:hypothetical protein